MSTVNIRQAKPQFSKLVDAVAHGDEVIIAKAGKPAAGFYIAMSCFVGT